MGSNIMSLNVGRFEMQNFSQIVTFAKGFLNGGTENVVVFHEVPYYDRRWDCKTQCMQWDIDPRIIYRKFRQEFSGKQYIIHSNEKKAHACTLAISNTGSHWSEAKADNFAVWGQKYRNRFVELENTSMGLRLLGIHTPIEDPNKSQKFMLSLKSYAEKMKSQRCVILGDWNVATDEWRKEEKKNDRNFCARLEFYEAILKAGYSDAVDREARTYRWGEQQKILGSSKTENGETMTIKHTAYMTTIDHVVYTDDESLRLRCTAQVLPEWMSDHATIIASVSLDEKGPCKSQ